MRQQQRFSKTSEIAKYVQLFKNFSSLSRESDRSSIMTNNNGIDD